MLDLTAPDDVVAVVSPRSIVEPLFERPTTITARNVDRHYSEPDVVRDAVRELRRLGFTVSAVSQVTVSISGPRRLFEEVFSTRLEAQATEIRPGQEAGYFAVAETPEQAVQPPERLLPLIEGVAVARPPRLYESPLSPLSPPGPYRYVNVPSEVGGILGATKVHRIGQTGLNVRVGMIDTGHFWHPFFRLHGYRRMSVLLGPYATDPADDWYGHGTGESANIYATAPGARLRPIKGLFDPVGDINVAVASTPKLQVLSNSWGYSADFPGSSLTDPYLIALEAAVANAVAKGIIVCFSAGNGHYGFPGSHPDVLSIGGVHVNYDPYASTLDFEASDYASSFDSSFYPGRHVPDFCGLVGRNDNGTAPLIQLPVQANSALDALPPTGASDDGWGIFSGTSAACPQVAGIVSLLLAYDPTLSVGDVRAILRDSARDVVAGQSAMGDAAGPGPDAATGAGLVNARDAWATLLGL
ncbi:MAG TPA: S8 family serine peptidase [Solirubrobacteraceae bacterium]|nr:S8 family serine peptidase [Solirubrobacteraceae bacterium]